MVTYKDFALEIEIILLFRMIFVTLINSLI